MKTVWKYPHPMDREGDGNVDWVVKLPKGASPVSAYLGNRPSDGCPSIIVYAIVDPEKDAEPVLVHFRVFMTGEFMTGKTLIEEDMKYVATLRFPNGLVGHLFYTPNADNSRT